MNKVEFSSTSECNAHFSARVPDSASRRACTSGSDSELSTRSLPHRLSGISIWELPWAHTSGNSVTGRLLRGAPAAVARMEEPV